MRVSYILLPDQIPHMPWASFSHLKVIESPSAYVLFSIVFMFSMSSTYLEILPASSPKTARIPINPLQLILLRITSATSTTHLKDSSTKSISSIHAPKHAPNTAPIFQSETASNQSSSADPRPRITIFPNRERYILQMSPAAVPYLSIPTTQP